MLKQESVRGHVFAAPLHSGKMTGNLEHIIPAALLVLALLAYRQPLAGQVFYWVWQPAWFITRCSYCHCGSASTGIVG